MVVGIAGVSRIRSHCTKHSRFTTRTVAAGPAAEYLQPLGLDASLKLCRRIIARARSALYPHLALDKRTAGGYRIWHAGTEPDQAYLEPAARLGPGASVASGDAAGAPDRAGGSRVCRVCVGRCARTRAACRLSEGTACAGAAGCARAAGASNHAGAAPGATPGGARGGAARGAGNGLRADSAGTGLGQGRGPSGDLEQTDDTRASARGRATGGLSAALFDRLGPWLAGRDRDWCGRAGAGAA